MGDWAQSAFYRLQEKEGTDHKKNQQQAEESHQLKAEAPGIWEQLARSVAEEVSDFSDLRPEYISMTDDSRAGSDPFFAVTASELNLRLEVNFDPANLAIHYRVEGPKGPEPSQGSFSFKLRNDEVMLHDGHEQAYTPPEAAELLLSGLI
jgi:hypothetical protein